jgi:hypothetical protein
MGFGPNEHGLLDRVYDAAPMRRLTRCIWVPGPPRWTEILHSVTHVDVFG